MKLLICILFFFQIGGLFGQDNPIEWPVYQGEDLKIDTNRLVPFRLLFSPKSARLDTIFRNPQVSHTIERSDYHDRDGNPAQGIRIRWVSNTHSFEDEAYIKASTFGIITNSATLNIRKQAFVHTYFGDSMAVRTILKNDSLPTTSITQLKYQDYYHLIIMPYLLASSDLEPGSKFQLPFFSGVRNVESLIKVQIIGPSEYTNKYGELKNAWRVDTDHGYARVEWYLDKFRPPYLLGYKWKTIKDNKVIRESLISIRKWSEYEGDDFDQIIIKN